MRIRLLVLALVALVAAPLGIAPTATAHPADEVSAEEDNPDGCVTAEDEDTPQCGAMGRNHDAFGLNTEWRPPIEACADRRLPSGSRVTRVLPDGPRHDDGSLAFIPGVCVYLPPGYGTSGLRYPVVYLLHGGGGDQGNWITLGSVPTIFDDAYAANPANAAIAVMPDGRSGFWFDAYDGSTMIETYVLRHVVPYIDRHFDTIADRSGRAIAGLSNGGYGALHLASKAPDLFGAAGSMSGNIGARSMGGLGTPLGIGDLQLQEAGAHYYGSVPIELIPNLDHVDVVMDIGTSCVEHLTVGDCAGTVVDHAFLLDNRAYRDRVEASSHVGGFDYRESEGGHTWLAWSTWLRDRHLPRFLARLADPTRTPARSPIPESFRYRSIKPAFSAHGYDVAVERPAKEFFDLTAVRASGFTVKGSGLVTVVTAPRYAPLGRYVVDGVEQRADAHGRLHVTVDLGPGHEHEQYSPPARALELQPDYWTERAVTIDPVAS